MSARQWFLESVCGTRLTRHNVKLFLRPRLEEMIAL
jgi:hypothetical protein